MRLYTAAAQELLGLRAREHHAAGGRDAAGRQSHKQTVHDAWRVTALIQHTHRLLAGTPASPHVWCSVRQAAPRQHVKSMQDRSCVLPWQPPAAHARRAWGGGRAGRLARGARTAAPAPCMCATPRSSCRASALARPSSRRRGAWRSTSPRSARHSSSTSVRAPPCCAQRDPGTPCTPCTPCTLMGTVAQVRRAQLQHQRVRAALPRAGASWHPMHLMHPYAPPCTLVGTDHPFRQA